METIFQGVLSILVPIAVIFFFWFLPIRLGLKWAKIKQVSKLWMLFGFHPMMGWIAYLILKYGIDSRKQCDKCKESIKIEAQICRYCGNEMNEEEIKISIKAFEDRKNKTPA
jgi:hypothetical protein